MEKIIQKADKLAVELACQAGEMLLESFGKGIEMELKGAINPVTEVDRRVEEFLVDRLSREFPDHDFLAEEQTNRASGAEFRWVIDPLDGTTNYAHGYPCFTVSIALERQGRSLLGVIYQPVTRELFTARAGEGFRLNGSPLRASGSVPGLDQAYLVFGVPYNLREPEVLERNLSRLKKFIAACFALRRDGSAAYDLACVAAGRYHGFWEEGLNAWDTSAGSLMIREAGGVITDFHGAEFHPALSATVLACGSAKLHREMLAILKDS